MSEFKKILPEQSLVKVVLNGGHQELDEATIPFTIGFDRSIAEEEPTHVLVIDFPADSATEDSKWRYLNDTGERRIYELSTVNFIQFHKSGRHHLIFILFRDITREQKKNILQKKSLRAYYENSIYLADIHKKGYVADNMVGYCEELVEIPQKFFAVPPKSGFKKGWHSWVNRWFLTIPIDECDFRRRVPSAITIQPIAWFLGFILRLFTALVLIPVLSVIVMIIFLSGLQAETAVWKNIGNIGWNFLFLYPKRGWESIFDFKDKYFDVDCDYYDIKKYKLGNWEVKVPISPLGLVTQILAWGSFLYCFIIYFNNWHKPEVNIEIFVFSITTAALGVWHLYLVVRTMPYEKVENWVKKKSPGSDGEKNWKVWLMVWAVVGLSLLAFLITQIPWVSVVFSIVKFMGIVIAILVILLFSKKIYRLFVKKSHQFNVWFDKTTIGKELIKRNEEKAAMMMDQTVKKSYVQFLTENMSIHNLPAKVNVNNIVAPTKAKENILRFKVGFWRMKSKVCRPYAKD